MPDTFLDFLRGLAVVEAHGTVDFVLPLEQTHSLVQAIHNLEALGFMHSVVPFPFESSD